MKRDSFRVVGRVTGNITATVKIHLVNPSQKPTKPPQTPPPPPPSRPPTKKTSPLKPSPSPSPSPAIGDPRSGSESSMEEENPSSATAPPELAEKKPGEDGDAPRRPSTPPSSSRRSDSAPPDRGAGSEAQDKVAKNAPAGPPNAPDGRSFSQLLAGAMAAPSQAQASLAARHPPPPPILTVPVVAVPCFLAPAALMESAGFAGQFAMTHQAVLATVTAQAQMQLQASYPAVSADSVTNSFPQPMLSTVSPVSLQKVPASASVSVSETLSGDLYHWRKYGQKQVKSSENSRSYYRCTDSNCFAKKKVERSPDGSTVQTIYGGKHNHEPPQKYKYTKERLAQSAVHLGEGESLEQSNIEPKESNPSTSKNEQNSGNEIPEQHLYCSSDCEVDTGSKNEEDVTDKPDSKRRLIEGSKSPSTPTQKTVREYIVRTEIDARHLSDGYRWRKYGQKVVKGNPNPRSYYRCTYDGCLVRKHVEKVPHDAKALLITYEGQHNHEHPTSKYSGDQSPTTPKSSPAAAAVEKQPTTGDALSDKKSLEDPSVSKVDNKLADDKKSELQGDNVFESAQSLLSIGVDSSSGEGGNRTTADNMKPSILNENPVPVSVHNS